MRPFFLFLKSEFLKILHYNLAKKLKMKFWLTKNSEIPVREQLVTQITLGIISGDLPVGEKLPSTREIARRFMIHSNTVSGVYRKLSQEGWLEFKKGSGFYVCENKKENLEDKKYLDKLIADFIGKLNDLGFSTEEIRKGLRKNLDIKTNEKIILVESDFGLREILLEELQTTLKVNIEAIDLEDFKRDYYKTRSLFIAMFDEKTPMEPFFSAGQKRIFLKMNSIPLALINEKRPSENDLIAVVSGWEKFLYLSKTILVAAKIVPECLILKNTKQKNWQKGLEIAAIIICDSLTATKLKIKDNVKIFPIISNQSITDIRRKYFGKTS